MTALPVEAVPPPAVTPEQFLELPESRHAELIDGVLVEKPAMSMESSLVTTRLLSRLTAWVEAKQSGYVLGEQCTYQCVPDRPRQVRRPDVSYFRRDRVTDPMFRGHVKIHPDLMAEVRSPNDLAVSIHGRVRDFRDAGTPLIWVVDPTNRVAQTYRGQTGRMIDSGGRLEGDDVLPGFSVSLDELFADLPEPVAAADPKSEPRDEDPA